MRTTENKLICYTSKKSSFLKKEIHSKLISSSQSKSGCKISYNKRCKLKPISHVKKTRRRKKVLSGKPIKTQQKVSDMGSAKRQSSLKLLGKSSSCLSRRGNWKNAAGNGGVRRSDKRRKRKRKKKNIEQDEASRLKRRARYLLIKMKLEQNLIDAYSGDGWKGQSREKIKPEKELQRAEKQILICKLGIRDAIHQLDLLSSEGCIEDSVIYPDGSVFHEHIFCAKCKSREAFPDNDIILCDGTCNCGFHQKCLEPPLEKIPPADQGWLCKFCECKMEILEAINAHLGTCFAVNSNWEDIFKEATISLDDESTYLDPAEEWPSEDSEDDDYYPERSEKSNSRTGLEGKMADDASSSSGLCCTSDDATSCFERSEDYDWDGGSSQVRSKSKGNMDCDSIISIGSGDTSDCEITSYRRQRRDVDYKKLYDEMFGKDLPGNEQQSEDEDWGPHSRKRRRIESDAGATISCGVEKKLPLISCDRKALFRIPHDAVEKLRKIFAENELPSRAVKENLSKQLGIASEKVSKWFKNARYAALKIRKAGSTKQQSHNIIKRSRASARKNQSSDGIPSTPNFLSFTSGVHVPKNLRRIRRRENLMSITTPLRKHHKRAAKAVPTGKIQKVRTKILIENQYPSMSVQRNLSKEKGRPYNQASTCPSNEVYLKKQVNGLRSKFPLTFNSTGRSVSQVDEIAENGQLYFVEMERLCNLEDRLEKLKAALLSCRDEDHASKIHSREQLLIYVPIAEVKEKA